MLVDCDLDRGPTALVPAELYSSVSHQRMPTTQLRIAAPLATQTLQPKQHNQHSLHHAHTTTDHSPQQCSAQPRPTPIPLAQSQHLLSAS